MQPEFFGMSAFGLLLVAVALWIYKMAQKKWSVFTAPAEAEFIHLEKEEDVVRDEYGCGYRTSTRYYPVFRFTVNGTEREVIHYRGAKRKWKWKPGKRISIHYNPLEQDSIMVPGDYSGEYLFTVAFGLPGALFVIGGILYGLGVI